MIYFLGYTIGWGKGIPDEYTQIVDDKHREFVVPDLKPNSEYVISLRAYNNIGDGRPIYETVSKTNMYVEIKINQVFFKIFKSILKICPLEC